MSPIDPGLQAERTALSWVRTSLGVAANGALVFRMGLTQGRLLELVAGSTLLALAIVVYGLGAHRDVVVAAHVRAGRSPAAPHLLGGLAAVTAALGVIVLISMLS